MLNKRRWLLTNWFSNFDPLKNFIVDEYGIEYHTVERAYQASKTLDKEERIIFTDVNKTESEIKRLGNSITLR